MSGAMSLVLPARKDAALDRRRPALRLVAGARAKRHSSPTSPAVARTAEVLLAGPDPARRSALRAELDDRLPHPASFAEADSLVAVLERAPTSRVVILDGDLEDIDAGALMDLLGRRHPELPVMRLDEPANERRGRDAAVGEPEPAAAAAAWGRG
jgi:CheY-like chemotaxis protein